MRIFAANIKCRSYMENCIRLWNNSSDAMLSTFHPFDSLYMYSVGMYMRFSRTQTEKNGGNRMPTAIYNSDDCTSYMLSIGPQRRYAQHRMFERDG